MTDYKSPLEIKNKTDKMKNSTEELVHDSRRSPGSRRRQNEK